MKSLNIMLKTGKIYQVNHSRKGNFKLLTTSQDETWVTGLIIEGKANAIMDYNIREQFEEITISKKLCSFKQIYLNENSGREANPP